MHKVRWVLDFAIDYGAVFAVAFFGAIPIFAWLTTLDTPPRYSAGLSGITLLMSFGCIAFAIWLWRDVRKDRGH